LNDKEELEHEWHGGVRIVFPKASDVKQVFLQHNVSGPDQADQVKAEQLSALVKLGVFDLGEMQFPVDLVQQVLLDDLVHNDGDQQVEEDGGDVFDAGSVDDGLVNVGHGGVGGGRSQGDVVVKGDEQGRDR